MFPEKYLRTSKKSFFNFIVNLQIVFFFLKSISKNYVNQTNICTVTLKQSLVIADLL